VAVAASKAKGRVSKWLREQLNLAEPDKLLSRSYFACTSGKSTAEDVAGYLDQQSEHHGYASRPCPPVFVQSYPITSQDEQRLSPRHAVAPLHLHMVLATRRRKGVFGRAAAERWRQLQDGFCIALEKVLLVPEARGAGGM
jgi:REP element-mobilizing transposase RayT